MASQKYKDYLRSPEWKAKRKELFSLRGKKCERCTATKQLHIHHLTYKNIFNEPLEDLQILCKFCHKKEHNIQNKKRASKIKKNKLVDKIGMSYNKPKKYKPMSTPTKKERFMNRLK